jgi:dihydropteroate synthase
MLHQLLPFPTLLQSKGQLLDLSTPIVMGILNATPDSFYNKGADNDMQALLSNAEKMIADGAKILDIGGASTKPGSAIIDIAEELSRVIPVVQGIHKHFPGTWLSVDTYHATVAREAINAGASIINDVSSGSIDAQMLQTVAQLKVPYIAMHMQGTPETMQQNPQYTSALIEVRDYLQQVSKKCIAHGIYDVIIDPGFGFGKTTEHNFQLLRSMHTFRVLGRPILAGISRKSIVCKPLKVSPQNALNGTTALHMIALQQGANILRVHDVKEAMECVLLYELLKK